MTSNLLLVSPTCYFGFTFNYRTWIALSGGLTFIAGGFCVANDIVVMFVTLLMAVNFLFFLYDCEFVQSFWFPFKASSGIIVWSSPWGCHRFHSFFCVNFWKLHYNWGFRGPWLAFISQPAFDVHPSGIRWNPSQFSSCLAWLKFERVHVKDSIFSLSSTILPIIFPAMATRWGLGVIFVIPRIA